METLSDIVIWYLVWTLVTVAFAPFVLVLFRGFTDRGASFARTFSALLFVWPGWFLTGLSGGLLPFNEVTIGATIVLGGIAGWVFAIRARAIDREALIHFGLAEAGTALLFAGYLWFRGYDPTLQWQEKLSDLMMVASTMQSESVPPTDAWLAGETINYYYVGYVPWAGIGKLIGTLPSVAYNIALGSVLACTVMTAFGVAANVVGRFHSLMLARVSGALAAFFLVFMATPWAAFTAIERRDTIWNGFWYGYLWDATRRLDGRTQPPITEFPSFSFQLGDLHPHLLALPYTILALGCAWLLATFPNREDGGSTRTQWPRIVVAGGVSGSLYAMNSWDAPAYFLICAIALAAGTRTWADRDRLAAFTILALSAYILWLPFHLHFEAPTASTGTAFADLVSGIPLVGSILASVAAWRGPETTINQYIGLFGFAYVVGIALIGYEVFRRRGSSTDPRLTRLLLVASGVIGLLGILIPIPLLILAAVPVLVIAWLLMHDTSVNPTNAVLLLFGTGFLLTLVTEFFYLLDVFNDRMNTVFKLYYQAWTMFAIGAAIGAVILWHALRSLQLARILIPAVLALMIAGGTTSTVIGMKQWNSWRSVAVGVGWIGMDGLHFLEREPPWAGEHGGIAWLYENATEDDVMLSAGGCEFTHDIGTTSAGSGIPTIIGWEGHERQWHLGQPGFFDEVLQRVEDINTLWATLDPALLDRYGITLIYIGPMEMRGPIYPDREMFTATCAPGPFENATDPDWPGEGWTLVYSNEEGVRIYRRDDG